LRMAAQTSGFEAGYHGGNAPVRREKLMQNAGNIANDCL
jgi:hypothetical protein